MQNTLIEKYFENKKRALLSYAQVLYKIYPADEESMWKSENDYDAIIKSIIDVYIKKYYCREKSELLELNKNNYSEDEFKLALSLAIIADTYGTKYEEIKQKYKKGLYDLTVIVYIITNIDKDINIISESTSINTILEKLSKYFKVINQEKIISKNPFIMDILANKIKDDVRNIKKFFKALDTKEAYNLFAKYDSNSYFVKFNFENELLEKYKETDVERVYEKYKFEEEFFEVSYELASLTILKTYSIGRKVKTLILPITSRYLKEEKHIKLINTLFGNVFIKRKIKFSINYTDYKKNREKFNVLRDMGFDLVLYFDKDEMILDYSNIKLDLTIYVKDKFIENNPKFLDFTTKSGIEYHIVNKNEYITESELINSCKED